MVKPHKGFRKGAQGDSDEKEGHVTPERLDASVNVPAGSYVDVPKGMVVAPGTEVDDQGVLRLETGELAIWHHRCKFHGPCERYTKGPENFVTLDEVVQMDNGARWCPDCIDKVAQDDQRKQLQEMFRGKTEEN